MGSPSWSRDFLKAMSLTFYVAGLAAEADVVEARYGKPAVIPRLCKGLLLPAHEDVGALLEPATPATAHPVSAVYMTSPLHRTYKTRE